MKNLQIKFVAVNCGHVKTVWKIKLTLTVIVKIAKKDFTNGYNRSVAKMANKMSLDGFKPISIYKKERRAIEPKILPSKSD